MGVCFSKPAGLTKETKTIAIQVFKLMDTDGNNSIDFHEALKFWERNFAKISSRAMFEAVDKDKNDKIDIKEWISFWARVKKSGHSEEDICEELNNLKSGGSWTRFSGVKDVNGPIKKID